ncbi:MAG TPA: DegT/DnrJ/EryC1/StrS family aminotransferase [Nocardioidaceae bacterium]|nr:DegT/DnrJ/EryC1/StrS family aminotransferase [Nocardioidaceae bacterium]
MEIDSVPFSRPVIVPEAIEAAQRVLGSGWVTTGPECEAFEREFAARVGAEHAVAVSSCTAAIELALRGLHLPHGAKVLTPAVTFCGAVTAIVHAGLTPVLVDVDPATAAVSPETCAAAARACGGADAMVVMHFAGFPSPVGELAEAAGLSLSEVVEDAAHALATWVGDRPVGGISRAACFSFYATKNLPIGEGGMVTTDDADLAAWLRSARLHGMSADAWRRYAPGGSWRYTVVEGGLKANLPDMMAAIGRAQLTYLDRWQRRRERIAERYTAGLAGVADLELPSLPARGRHAWHLYVVRVKPGFGLDRDTLATRLADRGIGTSVHFIPVHHMPYFQRVAEVPTGGLPGADAVFGELLSLPMHQAMGDDEVDYVCAALSEARHTVGSEEVVL